MSKDRLIMAAATVLVCTALVGYLYAATPEAYYRSGGQMEAFTSSSADYEGGDVIAIESGKRAGIVAADIDYSVNPAGNVYVKGLFDVTCSASLYWQIGDPVFWDSSGNTALRMPADDGDFYLGICVLAKSGSATTVRVSLNEEAAAGISEGDIVFFEDFVGFVENTTVWQEVDVNSATEAKSSNTHGGIYALTIAANDEAEDAVLYFGDMLDFDIDLLKEIEFRAAVTTPGSGVTLVAGLANAHNLDKDSVTANIWFRVDGGSMVADVETDDGTTDNDDNSTSTTLVTGTFYTFKIDVRDKTDIKFFIDGVDVTPETMTMAAFSTEMQPYFSLDKASGTSTGVLSIDWIRVVSARE